MVLKGQGKIFMPKQTMRGGARLYIESKVVSDSQFPLIDGDIEVEIDVENNCVILRPIRKRGRPRTKR